MKMERQHREENIHFSVR